PALAETLTLDQAVKAAVERHPTVRGAQASELAAEASADQARAPLLPSLTASATYNVSGNSANDTLGDPGQTLRGSLDADILVWDFGQTSSQWRSAQASADSARFDTRQARLDVVLSVRVAFFQARAA